MTARIRLATPDDAGAIAAIYRPIVLETPISFETEPPAADVMQGRIEKTLPQYPWLVYDIDDAVAGYVYGSRHRARAAYQWAVEVTVYVDVRYRGRGVGRRLYAVLLALLRAQGYYTAFGGITLPNAASVKLHETLGFKHIGTFPDIGYKSGAWHDVGWWALRLQELPAAPSDPLLLTDIDCDTVIQDVLTTTGR
ncbi:MAG: arsinothricin resistance N-acetyltransferase ArsN1 family B [Chloroflexota bacterium]